MKAPSNVHTTSVPAELKPLAKQLARDKAAEARARKSIERGMKAAARKVRTGR